jgi:parvulin-like peptidyl-prolyl isomerase
LPEDFEKVIFSLKPGEVSEAFQSGHGFHLFLVEEWIPRHPQKFFEARDRIFEILIASKERAATEAVVNQMLASASIEIYDPSLRFPLRGEGADKENARTN